MRLVLTRSHFFSFRLPNSQLVKLRKTVVAQVASLQHQPSLVSGIADTRRRPHDARVHFSGFWMGDRVVNKGRPPWKLPPSAPKVKPQCPFCPVNQRRIRWRQTGILQRLWSAQGRIPFHAIRNPRGLDPDVRLRIKRAMGEVGCWPLFVQDGSLSIQRLVAKARLLIRQEKVKLLVADYLQIVLANAKDERERLTRISNALRELAKSEGVPVLAISQLNRPRDGNLNARPNKFSLKESGSLENDAHTILLTFRPVDAADQPTGEDLLIVAKQRHGPVSLEPVYFDPKTLSFHERTNCAAGGGNG